MAYNPTVEKKYDSTLKGKHRKTKYELSGKGKRTRRLYNLNKRKKSLEKKLGE